MIKCMIYTKAEQVRIYELWVSVWYPYGSNMGPWDHRIGG